MNENVNMFQFNDDGLRSLQPYETNLHHVLLLYILFLNIRTDR
jgi:hypothetical protein